MGQVQSSKDLIKSQQVSHLIHLEGGGRSDVPLSRFTTLRVGGKAAAFLRAKTTAELVEAIKQAKKKGAPYLVIGSGSNLLISDEGFPGLVIKNKITGIRQDGRILIVKGGTSLQELVDFTIQQGLGGMQKLTGIPGTVGGAIFGNAGAYGQTISDYLQRVACLNPHTLQLTSLSQKRCGFEYRDSNFKTNHLVILEVYLKLPSADAKILADEAQQVLKLRQAKYPPQIKCPGSFFKNVLVEKIPPQIRSLIPKNRDTYGKVPAWYFLEEVGAKGQRLGNIKIADFHANLFINLGRGKAKDFWQLAKTYSDKVKEKFGITLEPEVQLINLPPLE